MKYEIREKNIYNKENWRERGKMWEQRKWRRYVPRWSQLLASHG